MCLYITKMSKILFYCFAGRKMNLGIGQNYIMVPKSEVIIQNILGLTID